MPVIIMNAWKAIVEFFAPETYTAWGWGKNSDGQLGDETTISKSSPVQTISGGNDWTQLSGGDVHAGGIKTDGTLWLWGDNFAGALGDNTRTSTSSPIQTISGGTDWAEVSIGGYFSAAIKTDGTLWGWGWNGQGTLGDNTTTNKSSPVQTVAGGTNWSKVASGSLHIAAIKTDGTLWTCGYNVNGQLGDNTTIRKSSPVQTIAGGTDWGKVSAGPNHTAAIKTDGTLWLWGQNNHGQLGNSSITKTSSPVQTIAGGTDWAEVSCGNSHTAAVKTDGTMWTWGNDVYGQLGQGISQKRSSPVQTVAGGTDWKDVECGPWHTAAIKTGGTIWSCGYNNEGQLGDGTTTDRSSPVQSVDGGTDWHALGPINGDYTLALKTYVAPVTVGELWVWGDNYSGLLGDGTTTPRSSPVQTIAGGSDWAQIDSNNQTMAIKTDGTLWMWGDNSNGQLGDGTTVRKSSPVQTIAGGTDWAYVGCGYDSAAAIKEDGTLWVWGKNNLGQLGDETIINKSSPIQTVAGGTDWAQVAGGINFAGAVKTDGTLWMWGWGGSGQLGDGTTVRKSSPVQTIAGGTDWEQVACGYDHSAAIKTDGTLWMWGLNGLGQLGDNSTVDKSSPVQTIAGGTDWASVACGGYFTAATKTDGTLWLCGYNSSGQLGDGTNVSKSSPVQTISGGTDWASVDCAYSHFVAIKTDGSLWTCGYDGYGALGDGTTVNKSSPVQTVVGGTKWIKAVAGLYSHTMAIKQAPVTYGELWGWGQNAGSLGDGTTTSKSSPVQTISGGTDWTQIDAGFNHTAAIKTDGTLWLWGGNTNGSLGDNTTTTKSSPVQTIAGGTDWDQVACAYAFTSAIKTDGTLWTWGLNDKGQHGDTTITEKSSPVQTVAGGTDWSQVAVGARFTSAIKTDGTLWSWGQDFYGQLGDNSSTDKSSPVQTVAGGTDWAQVDCGYQVSSAIKTDGTLWTWGQNEVGQLGDGTTTRKSSPVQTITGGTDWVQVSIDRRHGAAIKTDGTLWTWGWNIFGQLGDGTTVNKSSPVQTISGGTDWDKVVCGYNLTIALKTDGSVWLWGQATSGKLGDETTTDKSSPIQTVTGGTDWIDIGTGKENTWAIKQYVAPPIILSGELWGWGFNTQGQLGDGTIIHKSSPVQTITGGTDWAQVASGERTTSGIKTDGTLWLWGYNLYGMIGDNSIVDKSSPVQTIAGGTDWKQVATGDFHSAAIKTDGTLWTWGRNNIGQLGDNSSPDTSSPIQTVAGGTDWAQVACGEFHSAAIKTDGTLWSWGYNGSGEFGDGTTTSAQPSPVQTIAGGTDWSSVACGNNHTIATKTDGTLWIWGHNFYGQLGDNSTTNRSSPVQTIPGGTDWEYVEGGKYTTSAIKTDGTLWTWGYNSFGQLGDGTQINKSSPIQTVTGGNDWKYVNCGGYHMVASKTDGTVWSWGHNTYGQLGNNESSHRSAPVQTLYGGTDWTLVACGRYQTFSIGGV